MRNPSYAHGLFARFAQRGEAELPLDEGALLVALEEDPRLRMEDALGRLDHLASGLRSRLGGGRRDLDGDLERMSAFLFEEEGFRGERSALEDPRGHYLHEVLRRRVGIPISLSILFLEVGRRAGLRLRGINFPGHFLVRAEGDGETRIVDAFQGGRTLTVQACRGLLHSMIGDSFPFREELLAPATTREILVRVLTNLKHLHLRRSDVLRAASAVDRILLLVPDAATEIRDRGLLLGALGHPSHGLQDLERYLSLAPLAEDGPWVRKEVDRLRLVAGGLN